MSENPDKQSKFKVFWARYGGTGFVVSFVIHATLLLAALFWVVNEYVINPRKAAEAPPPKEQSKQAKQIDFTIQTARQKNMASSQPMNVQRIAVADSKNMALPETPELPNAGFGGGFNIGQGGVGLGGFAGGGGSGGMGGPAVKIPAFGFANMQGGAFRGELYDLKQSPNGKLIEPRTNFAQAMKTFFEGNWNRAILRKFYQAPTPLYAVQFYVPWMNAAEAPKAFKAEQQIAPSNWIALYEAKVSPPSSGRYRFIGAADDLVAVRFNGKLVLEAYWGGNITAFKPSSYVKYPSIQGANRIPGFPNGFVAGEWINLDANQAYPMQVVLGERPGGQYWGYLFVEKEGENYKKNAKGDPEFPIFRVRRGITEESGDPKGWSAPFIKESPVWKVY